MRNVLGQSARVEKKVVVCKVVRVQCSLLKKLLLALNCTDFYYRNLIARQKAIC
jgi:hypothetical protein